ncbi:peptidylprolyl isomerase [Paenibacillus xanthanilyticus]|uniref:Peptidyl-prolyl cis-trans isomerase n=1 Tax=Paenibacillus xanthanilyticus TaxID=1783531 RepID=A0ABV8K4Y8_9BACL
MQRKRLFMTLLLSAALIAATAGCGAKQQAEENNGGNATTGGGTTQTESNAGNTANSGGNTAAEDSDSASQAKSWDKMPEMSIDTSKTYLAHFKTSKGDFTVELFAKDAPQTVNSFVFLANEKFYDGIKFHRIIETFMIQTGDPLGNGTGGPGYDIPDELDNGHQYEEGIVAMANAGPNTGGSQFFICTGPDAAGLNMQPNYTIFGKVTEGMDVVTAISKTPVEANMQGEPSQPTEEVTIDGLTIEVK